MPTRAYGIKKEDKRLFFMGSRLRNSCSENVELRHRQLNDMLFL